MSVILAVAFVVLLALCTLLNLVTLPGNWIVAVLVLLWTWLWPAPQPWYFYAIIAAILLLGEVLDFLTQAWGAKKYGSSNRGALGGMIGAIFGAILLAPFLFGLGAALGALAGAWVGSFVVERLRGMPMDAAIHSANGSLLGRFLGMVLKFGLGIALVFYCARPIWDTMTL